VLDHVGLIRNEFDELKHSFECHFAIRFGKQNVSLHAVWSSNQSSIQAKKREFTI